MNEELLKRLTDRLTADGHEITQAGLAQANFQDAPVLGKITLATPLTESDLLAISELGLTLTCVVVNGEDELQIAVKAESDQLRRVVTETRALVEAFQAANEIVNKAMLKAIDNL